MTRWWPALFVYVWLLAAAGCGGDPAPKPLTADEEKQFEQQRQQDRQKERQREPAAEG
jgi:hypothetical protein